MNETKGFSLSGIPLLLAFLIALALLGWWLVTGIQHESGISIVASITLGLIWLFLVTGFFIVQPNQGRVLQLFGRYKGTERREGLRWTNPFIAGRTISLRVRNFESGKLKVNDFDGNPIEIAAVVVWKVVDTAEAVFQVEDYDHFVRIQSESALRQMAQSYAYDSQEEGRPTLRTHGDEINDHLRDQIQERLDKAGVKVMEARISHLAYAQEIAQAMLQRQQAGAIVAARARIVEGAVGMVGMALDELKKQGVVDLDEERRAAMVSNLLVVLCGERSTQPIVNTGTLYNG